MIRLFVGLQLPEYVAARLQLLCNGLPGARWVEPANMHVTLRFIGEIDEPEAEGLDRWLAGVTAPSFDVELQGLGTFGQGHKIRALWTGVAPSSPLNHLQAKIESAVVRSGQSPETRRFTPHVTLARFARPGPVRLQSFVEGNNLFQAGPFHVDQFTLFESRLGKGGAVYTPLAHYELS
tara:strand:+ start:174 stop:710 length:537 start_codon:yes stop_codon:yes gene_type:complete